MPAIVKKAGTEEKRENNLLNIVKGSIISILVSLIALLLIAVLLTYTNVSESIIPIIIIVVSALSILAGSFISTMKTNSKGLINGGAVGAIYIVTLYLLSSFTVSGFSLNIKSDIMIVTGILAGMIGGIIGVNLKTERK